MKLTPFEQAALKREQHTLFVAAVEATQTVKELADECKTQIEYYKSLVLRGAETIEERNVLRKDVDQAIHDNKNCNSVFVELANTMEERFGINA